MYNYSPSARQPGQSWWSAPGPLVADALFEQVRGIEENQYEIARSNFYCGCLYTNREPVGYDWGTGTERSMNFGPINTHSENVISQVVETISALIGKNRPKPTPVVKDATFSIERMAADLDRYLYAEFRRHDVYLKGSRAFDDSCHAAVAALKIDLEYDEDGKPIDYYVENVLPDEVVVDEREARTGMPLQMYQRKLVPRDVLRECYPDQEHLIDTLDSADPYTSYRTPANDLVVVIEAWRLPHMGHEGRHVVSTADVVLVDEEYTRDRFPFVFLRWFQIPGRFYGRSLVEELVPGQIRYTELDTQIRRCQDTVAVPRFFADAGSDFSVEQLDNSIAKIIRFRGRPPEAVQWPAASAELYQERERVYAQLFQTGGISQLSAQGKLPDGARLDSSRALREYNMIENDRFAKQAQRYEQFFIDLAYHILELSAVLHEHGTDHKVEFHNRSLIHEIAWSDVRDLVEDKRFQLQIEASSITNMTPAARHDIVNTWVQAGWIPAQRGMQLLGYPDLEEEMINLGAGIADIKRVLEDLDNVDAPFPTPSMYQDLDAGPRMVQLTYLRRRNQKDVPDEVLARYEDWMAQALGLKRQATAWTNASRRQAEEAAMAAQGMGAGAPPGMDALQANLQPENVTPEGQIMPGIATTAMGVPIGQ